MQIKLPYRIAIIALLLLPGAIAHAQCSPIMGLGSAQWFDNTGVPLTSGVLYAFQAGTSTQQATFTDSTCTVQNVNPITFGTGARVAIWLTTANFYKFVLCAQNDGSSCAGGDILFSVDNVPGGATGGGGGGGSPFISGSANPATSGILRLASGDSICWRNVANSSNLCFSKDTNDLLSWAGGTFKLPEVSAPTSVAGFDILEADSTAHRFKQCSNGTSCAQIANAGVDISTSDQVVSTHLASPLPLAQGGTAQTVASTFNNTAGAYPTLTSCGNISSSGSCAGTALGNTAHILFGTCAYTASTSCTVTGFTPAFTSSSSYFCVVTQVAGITNQIYTALNSSATSVIFTASVSNSDTIAFICAGN